MRVVTRNATRKPRPGTELAVADLKDLSQLRQAFRGARAVLTLLPDDFGSEAFHAQRRAMAEAMTRALRREGVPRIVLLSSCAAALGERAGNGLGAELAYFERLVSGTSAAVTILRASYFQDNVAQLLPAAASDGIFPNFFAERSRKLTTIAASDVGMFAARALLEPPQAARDVVDLVGPDYSPADMAAVVARVTGRRVELVDVPSGSQERAFRQWMSRDAARAMVETLECLGSGRIVLGGQRVLRGDTRLEQVLGGTPTTAPEVRP